MPFVTNAWEELAASIFRTDYTNGRFPHNVGNYLSICNMGDISVMMEIRIVCHACKLACVSDFQAFEGEDELFSYYVSLNRTQQPICAVVFEKIDENLRYKIRISNTQFFTAQLFPEFLLSLVYEGKAHNICNIYII